MGGFSYNNLLKEETEAMELWIRTGCVCQDYLDRVLGEQSEGISPFLKGRGLERVITKQQGLSLDL